MGSQIEAGDEFENNGLLPLLTMPGFRNAMRGQGLDTVIQVYALHWTATGGLSSVVERPRPIQYLAVPSQYGVFRPWSRELVDSYQHVWHCPPVQDDILLDGIFTDLHRGAWRWILHRCHERTQVFGPFWWYCSLVLNASTTLEQCLRVRVTPVTAVFSGL